MRIELTENARRVLESRYLLRGPSGEVVETPGELFDRVARAVAAAEDLLGAPGRASRWTEQFSALLSSLEFLPNSPTLSNAGRPRGQLAACFVLPVEDSLEEIFDSLKLMALIQQSGGGTGFSFSRLRPRGDRLGATGGASSGPVSFMRIFDCATENIRQGGKRQGANMGILRVDHPDILEFIEAKADGRSLAHFNLSVGITDEFLEAVLASRSFTLRHPRSGAAAGSLDASEVLSKIAGAAWRTGDPGLVFLDAINRANPTPHLGSIESTNPCGEVPLLPYEACVLGSVNLARMVRGEGERAAVDWEKLARTVRLAVRFLDDVIEVNHWPSPRIASMCRGNRKIGLGVLGFAEMLILLGIPYGSEAAVSLAEELARRLSEEARGASEALAQERGEFPNWPGSAPASGGSRVRNATRISIAPTGTISIVAGTSAGIEPLFALAYRRENVLDGQVLTEVNPLFLRHVRRRVAEPEALLAEIVARGSLAEVPGLPPQTRSLFRTALELSPEDHLRVQAAFQKHVDNAVSKTINLPESATADEVRAIYLRAWRLGLKGITIYRYGSRERQVLRVGAGESALEYENFARCDPQACKL
ncbi:MAG: adenosylcobalamin-dependent ribonucleoside-diphosphate reductase [Acidobacteriota bacterium]